MTTISSRLYAIQREIESVAVSLGVRLMFSAPAKATSFDYLIRITGIPEPNGLSVQIGDDYRRWHIQLVLDAFSGPLLDLLSKRFRARREEFEAYVSLARSRHSDVWLHVNGADIELSAPDETWHDLSIVIANTYPDDADEMSTLHAALLDLLCLVLCLLIEKDVWEVAEAAVPPVQIADGDEEGAQYVAHVNKYERSRYNRAICLSHFGFRCVGCGNDLQEVYGPLGAGVIHVHHIVPLSQMGGSYRLNPLTDLVPLCPNCHNVVHRESPPVGVAELQRLTGWAP